MKMRKIYKRLLIVLILIYVIYVIINQQKVLNQYSKESQGISAKIEAQKEYNSELANEKENVNSKEFIENAAREKLGMYYPNEKVYVDKGM